MSMTRRRFLAGSAAAFAGATALGESPVLPIVDTHQHLWDLSRIHPPWLKKGNPLTRDYVMKDYLDAIRGLGKGHWLLSDLSDLHPAGRAVLQFGRGD